MADEKKAEVETIAEYYSAYNIAKMLLERNKIIRINGILTVYLEKYNYYESLEQTDPDRTIRKLLPEEMRYRVHSGTINEIVKWMTINAQEADQNGILKRRYCINCKNGVINLKKDKIIREKTPELYFQNFLNIDVPDILRAEHYYDNSKYKQMITQMFRGKNSEFVDDYEEAFGLLFSNVRDMKISVWLYGPSNTGKSVSLNMGKGIIGKQFSSNLSFSQLNEEFATASLAGKMANFSGEISGMTEKRVDTFKSLVGNDEVQISFKHQNYFSLQNTALLMFACNNLPVIPADEVASVLERVLIIPLFNSIPRNQWIDNLSTLLATNEEREIVLARAIEGLKRLFKSDFKFSHQDKLNRLKGELMRECNSFKAFSDEMLTEDNNEKVLSSEIYQAYQEYCEQYDLDTLEKNRWPRQLEKIFPSVKRTTMKSSTNKQNRAFKGIRLKDTGPSNSYYDKDNSLSVPVIKKCVQVNTEDMGSSLEQKCNKAEIHDIDSFFIQK